MSEEIFSTACITVVWSRPPNSLAMAGNEYSVTSRNTYMPICRAMTRGRRRLGPHRSSTLNPKVDAVMSRIWPG